MEILYEKQAIQEYMDEINNVGNILSSEKDMSMNSYNSCKQQYTRLHTRIEEEIHRAQNRLEAAESMYRSAMAEYNAALSRASSADEDESGAAQSQVDYARMRVAEAEAEIDRANAELAEAQGAMQNLTSVWEQHSPLAESAASRIEERFSSFVQMSANGNSDLGQYIGIMEQAKSSLYEETSTTATASNSVSTSSGVSNGSAERIQSTQHSLSVSKDGQTVQMMIGGQNYTFPNTKSGMAKAYRTAMRHGEKELAGYVGQAFGNKDYMTATLSMMQQGLGESFDRQMVTAGAQNRKLRSPKEKGTWNGDTFFLDDEYIPKHHNDSGATIAEIKSQLLEKYNIKLDGILYKDGVADFSSISIANISTADVVMRSHGLSESEYQGLTQRDRAELFQKVFGDVDDGKSKREKNFHIADQITSERHIPIVGLPDGYSAKDLADWRRKNSFSWDEQVHDGYNLVPTVIHENVSHTGLVSTAKHASQNIKAYEEDVKQNPEKYSWSEEEAPISLRDLQLKDK